MVLITVFPSNMMVIYVSEVQESFVFVREANRRLRCETDSVKETDSGGGVRFFFLAKHENGKSAIVIRRPLLPKAAPMFQTWCAYVMKLGIRVGVTNNGCKNRNQAVRKKKSSPQNLYLQAWCEVLRSDSSDTTVVILVILLIL